MEVLDKFDGDEDLTLIPPEDGEQTDEEVEMKWTGT